MDFTPQQLKELIQVHGIPGDESQIRKNGKSQFSQFGTLLQEKIGGVTCGIRSTGTTITIL
jgi:putative aminopeptidase FrvX